jgi:hypothetical protein
MRILSETGFTRTLAALALAAVLPVLSGCTHAAVDSTDTSEPAYGANMVRGCAVELEHPYYDPELPGYWLVGNNATLQISHLKGVTRPKTFSFMLRTKPDATLAKPSELDIFKILTSNYRIVTKFNPNKTAPVDILAYTEKKEGTEVVLVKTDTTGKYVTFERVGERIKVTLTEEGMNLIGEDAAISWVDLPPGKKSESEHSAAESEGWRKVIDIKPVAKPGL